MGDYRLWMNETPFGKATRQNLRTANSFTYVAGQRESQSIPRTGYLARIHWHFNGTLTVTLGGGTAALDALGPYNALSRVRLSANSGTDIFNTSGYGAYLVEQALANKEGYITNASGLPAALSYSVQVYQAATASGAQTWDFGLTLPVAVNEMSELGLILLQNELASISLGYEYNSIINSLTGTQAPVLATGAAVATLTGTISPLLEYFAVPTDPNARPDITWIHQIIENTTPVGAVGDNTINLLRENIYLGILHHVILNNAPNTTDVDRVRLTFNTSDTPYDVLKRSQLQYQRRLNHYDLPLGVYLFDLFNQGFNNFGDERDIINGKATSELQSIITIATAATLGTNASRINTITRQLVRLTTPPVGGV